MKSENPIEEIWRIRDELSAEYGYDVHRIFAALREKEKKHGDRLVRVVSRHAPEESAAAPPGPALCRFVAIRYGRHSYSRFTP